MVKIFSSNKTDTSLNGLECKPDITAHFEDISVARSHGPRYRDEYITEEKEPVADDQPPRLVPITEHMPKTMPSGDAVVAIKGIGGENFDRAASAEFIMKTMARMGSDIGLNNGSATMAMVVKSKDSLDLTHLGDTVITIVGKDKEGKRAIKQLTFDQIGTHVVTKPKHGAVKDAEGKYKDEDMNKTIQASPYNYIGGPDLIYQPHEETVTSYSYNDIEELFGKDAVIIVSTDGLYDSALHEEYKCFDDPGEQHWYINSLVQKTLKVHEEFLGRVVEELEGKGYTPEHPKFAELLTRYVRSTKMHDEPGHPKVSYDDCGIVCFSAARPKDSSEQTAVLVTDAIGSTKLDGVKVSRRVGEIFEEEALATVPNAPREFIEAQEYEHMYPVQTFSNAQIKYGWEMVDGENKSCIIMEFNEPKDFSRMKRGMYDEALEELQEDLGVKVEKVPAKDGQPDRVKLLIPPEEAHKVERLTRFVGGRIFNAYSMSPEWHHNGSLNELANCKELQHFISPEQTKLLQEVLRTAEKNAAAQR